MYTEIYPYNRDKIIVCRKHKTRLILGMVEINRTVLVSILRSENRHHQSWYCKYNIIKYIYHRKSQHLYYFIMKIDWHCIKKKVISMYKKVFNSKILAFIPTRRVGEKLLKGGLYFVIFQLQCLPKRHVKNTF